MSDLLADGEGSASSAHEIADELNRACDALRRVDYNAVAACGELGELLEARDILHELCLTYRRRQGADHVRLSNEHGNAPVDDEPDE